jgi:hypothetical protein
MKYSVGDIFIDDFGNVLVVVGLVVLADFNALSAGQYPYYLITANGRKSHLRWFDTELSSFKNITCPVLKELHS